MMSQDQLTILIGMYRTALKARGGKCPVTQEVLWALSLVYGEQDPGWQRGREECLTLISRYGEDCARAADLSCKSKHFNDGWEDAFHQIATATVVHEVDPDIIEDYEWLVFHSCSVHHDNDSEYCWVADRYGKRCGPETFPSPHQAISHARKVLNQNCQEG